MAVGTFLIAPDDPRRDDIRALLEAHLAFANEVTPAEHVNALGLTGLLEPGITFFSLRVDGELLGIGALKELDPGHGELKSMHTTKAARRGGVGRAMVAHLVATARDRGYGRISLETGDDGGLCARAGAVRRVRLRALRPVRRLQGDPEQHLHDDGAARRPRAALKDRGC